MLSEALRKKSLRPARRRELAAWLHGTFQVSGMRACRLAQFSRAAWYRRSRAKDQSGLRIRIRDLAHARPRFGYLRIWVLLRREGWLVNRKRVRRLYRLEGLQLRMRVRRRKHIALHHGSAPIPVGPTERWSMDSVHDTLADGRPFRILTVVDNWGRCSPVLEANAFIESFNGRLRDECLNVHQFASLAEAQTIIEAWRMDYNHHRPHGSLGHLTPSEVAAQRQASPAVEEAVCCLVTGPTSVP